MAGSLIASNSDYILQTIIAKQIGIQNYYQSFSRDQEREADIYAIKTLNNLNLSNKPLIKFLNLLEKKSIQSGLNDEYYKFSSHPIYKERYKIIENKNYTENNNSDIELNKKFNFVRSKLFGFTEKDINIVKKYLEGDFLKYALSIMKSKEGKLKESLQILNGLLEKKQNQIFIFETKADILYSNGFLNESELFYTKVINSYPDNIYVSKKIFEIKFSLLKVNDKIENINLLNKYSFLLEKFTNNIILKKKFIQLANKSKQYEWIEYFKTEKKIYEKNTNKKEIIEMMIEIKKNTSNESIIRLIDKNLDRLNKNV